MNCEQTKENMFLYLYGELEADEKNAFAEHLKTCATCAAELAEHEKTLALARQADTPEPSLTVMENIRNAASRQFAPVREPVTERKFFRFPVLTFPRLASLAAAAVLLFVIGSGLNIFRGTEPAQTAYAWESVIDEDILALQDEVDVLEWEIHEAGEYASIDQQILDLEDDLEEGFDDLGLF